MWFNKDESHYRVCDSSGEDPHCSDKYILVRCGVHYSLRGRMGYV